MNEKKSITSLAEFLEWTEQFKAGQYLFRGLPNDRWDNIPSTYLRLDKDRQNVGMLIKLNKELLEAARRLGYGTRDGDRLSDLQLLADLQHRRAATCLIDFTNSAFVALWFACQSPDREADGSPKRIVGGSPEREANGKVFAVRIDTDDFETITSSQSIDENLEWEKFFKGDGNVESPSGRRSKLYHWQPNPVNDNIITQKSNFIFGDPEIIAEVVEDACVIDQNSKSKILDSLNKSSGINESAIYPGLDDFARRHSSNRPYNEPDVQDHIRSDIDAHIEDDPGSPDEDPDGSDDAIAYHLRGLAHAKKGEHDEAIREYTNAIKLDRNDASVYYNRGTVYAMKGDLDNAIRDLDEAIERNPKYAEAYHNRGAAYANKGELDAAIADFDKAIELNPTYAEAYNNRGAAYIRNGDFDAAIADCSKAIELNPTYAKAYNNRGAAYFRKDNFDAAIADCSKAIELNPNDATAYSIRGAAYTKKGDFDAAIADCSKAIELNPNDPIAYKNRSMVYAFIGEYEKASQDREKAAELERASGGES